MKRSTILFLKALVVLKGVTVLALLLWEPHLEGRNVGATLFEIYFKDPFLAYAYASSIPFFVALYQVFKVLGYIGENRTFSRDTLKAVRIIKRCAVLTAGLVAGAVAYIVITMRGKDDIAGGVAIGLFMICVSVVAAVVVGMLERAVRKRAAIS